MGLMCDPAVQPAKSAVPTEDMLLTAWTGHGDRQALGELFVRCRPRAYALARGICGPAAAEDVVQEGFLKAMRGARTWSGRQAVGWLLAVVANTARNQVRGEIRRLRHETAAPPPPPGREPSVDLDLGDAVRAALDELPVRERSALELRFLAGLDVQATAEALDRPYKTVHGQIERGLERLRGLLGRRGYALGTAALALALAESGHSAEPAGLAAAVQRVAETGPLPPSVWPMAVAAGLLAAAGAIFAIWLLRTEAPPAVASHDPPPAPLVGILDQQVDIRFVHDRVDEALMVLAGAVPAGQRLRYAILSPLQKEGMDPSLFGPLGGVVWRPAGLVSVRTALDVITAQAGLAWSMPHDAVVVYRPAPVDAVRMRAALEEIGRDIPARQSEERPGEMDLGVLASGDGFWAWPKYYFVPEQLKAWPDQKEILRAAGSTPEGVMALVDGALDPTRPWLGRVVTPCLATSIWATFPHATTPAQITPSRITPLEAIVGEEQGAAALRCLRALAVRTQELQGTLSQATLAARVAAVVQPPGAADAIAALLDRGPPTSIHYGVRWYVALGLSLALLDDQRAQDRLTGLLVCGDGGITSSAKLPDVALGEEERMREWSIFAGFRQGHADSDPLGREPIIAALGIGGAWDVLAGCGRFDALGWSRRPEVARRLAREPVATPEQAARVALALLRLGAAAVPPGLAEALTVGTTPEQGPVIATALIRGGGRPAVEAVLAWAGTEADPHDWRTRCAGEALALAEDPLVPPRLAEALTAPRPGTARAAAIGLALSRQPGAAELLRHALAILDPADPRALDWWAAAYAGRDEVLALAAVAEVRRRGADGVDIFKGLGLPRTAEALRAGWALVTQADVDPALRLAAVRALPQGPAAAAAQDEAIAAVLGLSEASSPELRVAALLAGNPLQGPAARTMLCTILATDSTAWVRASAAYAVTVHDLQNEYPVDDVARVCAVRLRQDPSPQVRAYLAIGISDVDVLTKALAAETHPRVREALALQLGQCLLAEEESKDTAIRSLAGSLVANERDAAARHALQGLADGRRVAALRIGSDGAVSSSVSQPTVAAFRPDFAVDERNVTGVGEAAGYDVEVIGDTVIEKRYRSSTVMGQTNEHSWSRTHIPPRRLADDEEPTLPISDG